jgi:hypothetical protein
MGRQLDLDSSFLLDAASMCSLTHESADESTLSKRFPCLVVRLLPTAHFAVWVGLDDIEKASLVTLGVEIDAAANPGEE